MCCQHRSVTPQRQTKPKPVVERGPVPQRTVGSAARPVVQNHIPTRQGVSSPGRCQVCGYPLQVVNIAGKTTTRCSNQSCGG